MAKRIRVQVTFERDTALARDAVVNTWHFEGDGPDPGSIGQNGWDLYGAGVMNRLVNFYTAFGARMSQALSGNALIRAYNMAAPTPRIPIGERAFTIAPVGSAMPSEVALCLSFEGRREAGIPQARRRGRIYLGPWNASQAGGEGTSGDARPSVDTIAMIMNAYPAVARPSADGGYYHAVYSPTQDRVAGNEDLPWNDVVRAWIDDAWDTQRRRGARPTTRTVRTL